MQQDFNQVYRDNAAYYGAQASPMLVHYLHKYGVAASGKALDLGCGQGRNALYLARQGYAVTGMDSSAEAIAHLTRQADLQSLDVCGQVVDMARLEIQPRSCQLIVANTSLDHLTAAQGAAVAQTMQDGLAPGGYLFVSVFMVNDPGHVAAGEQASETASHVRHYYQPDELRQQFAGLQLLAYQEEYALDVSHGAPHFHGIARLFARRPA